MEIGRNVEKIRATLHGMICVFSSSTEEGRNNNAGRYLSMEEDAEDLEKQNLGERRGDDRGRKC